ARRPVDIEPVDCGANVAGIAPRKAIVDQGAVAIADSERRAQISPALAMARDRAATQKAPACARGGCLARGGWIGGGEGWGGGEGNAARGSPGRAPQLAFPSQEQRHLLAGLHRRGRIGVEASPVLRLAFARRLEVDANDLA